MSKTITVMVPVYNMKKYLRTCFDSILAQTYKDFILLVVDDGSDDGSAGICDEYAAKDSRVKVIHTKNEGQGAARNTALKNIETDYVAMVDADDCVNIHFLERLMNIMDETGADIVSPGHKQFLNDEEIDYCESVNYDNSSLEILTRDEAVEKLCLDYSSGVVIPQKLYKTEVLKGISYPLIGVNIDEWAINHLLMNANRIVIGHDPLYYYRSSPEGMTRNFSAKKISGVLAVIDRINVLNKNGYNQYDKALYSRLHTLAQNFYHKCKEVGIDGKKLLKPAVPELRKAFNISVKNRKDLYSRKEMVIEWMFCHNFSIYDLMCKVFKYR